MAHSSLFAPALPSLPKPTGSVRRSGIWLAIILGIALGMTGTGALVASGLLAEEPKSRLTPPGDLPALGAQRLRVSPLTLPGFQRRGNLLTGELRASDGSIMRLVIDARSNTIIGYRVVEPANPGEAQSR